MKLRVFVLLLFITAVLGFSQEYENSDDWFVGKPIKDIIFTGLKNISLPEIDALMRPYKGLIFDDVFLEIQEKLYALEYFEFIEPTTVQADEDGGEVILSFNVIERPVVGSIVFSGNSELSDEDLGDVITTKVNDIYNQAKIRADVEAIKNLYIEEGFSNTIVEAEENTNGDSYITVTFGITEAVLVPSQDDTLYTSLGTGSITEAVLEPSNEFALGSSQRSENDDNWFVGKPIKDIIFTGLKNISLPEIDALMQPYKGRIFDDIVFWEIQGKLYALEYFERIDPTTVKANANGSEVILRFNVIERPIVGRIVFSGNSGLRNRDISDVITTKVNDIYNQAKIRVDIEAIKNLYIEKGFPNATVEAEENTARDSSVTVTFLITEYEKISISKIEFEGNTIFSNNRLKSQLSLKAKSLLNKGAFQEAALLADREAVAKYYHDRGYIDAVVRDVTRTYDTDSKGTNLTLTFWIDEGSEFTFGGISFSGNVIFTSEQLEKLITTKTGEVVNSTKLETDLQRVSDLYYENGYIFNSIVRTPEKNYVNNTISYTITIVERNRAYIENIIILGNEKTKTDVILREIPLESGDVFSRTKVMEALRNLYNLQFFSTILPDTLQGSAENLMELVITVEEQMTTDLQFGLSFSGTADPEAFPISGLFEWTDRNLAGTGNQIGLRLNSSIVSSSKASLNYLQRWILGLPLSLGVELSADYSKLFTAMNNQNYWFRGDELYAFPDGFTSYDEYVAHDKLPPREFLMNYNQLYISLALSSGYRWSTLLGSLNLSGGTRLGVIRNSYNEIFTPFDPALKDSNKVWTPKNSLWTSISLDQRDIYYDPSSGYYLLERMGFYGVLGRETEHYMRSDSKAQYFYTLFDIPVGEKWSFKSVLAANLGISFLFNQPGRELVIEEANKLSVDGMFVGRGWSSAFRDKGLMLVDSWVELRFPLVRGILAFDMFFDGAGVETQQGYYFGKNADNKVNFTIDNMRFSFGGALRVALPQFPIRAGIAKRFRFVDGNFTWVKGSIFGKDSEHGGVDLVISFVVPY
jgi:outer membrane protein insertion porin family